MGGSVSLLVVLAAGESLSSFFPPKKLKMDLEADVSDLSLEDCPPMDPNGLPKVVPDDVEAVP